MLLARGLSRMDRTSIFVEHRNVGKLQNVTLRLDGNDGFHFSELHVHDRHTDLSWQTYGPRRCCVNQRSLSCVTVRFR